MDRVSNNQGDPQPLRVDLPSRDHPIQYTVQEAAEVCAAWRSGRLVDCEAIDRGALLDFLIGFHRWGEVEVDMLVRFLFGDTG